MNSPLVSIITPSFNRVDMVRETAESIFRQTYPHWEWMIVDDGSSDGTWELLSSIASTDERIKLIRRCREPKGACTCRNIAVNNCTGVFVLFLDTDDILDPICLEQRVTAFESFPDCDFLIFPMLLFQKQISDMNLLWNVDSEQDDIERFIMGNGVCPGTGTLWKKDSFVRFGMWDESLLLWQDVELHLRSILMGAKYKKCLGLKPDIYLRVSGDSISRSGFHSPLKVKSRIQVLSGVSERLSELSLIDKYRTALRQMFTSIFFSAANSRAFHLVRILIHTDSKWGLFSAYERNVFRMYDVMLRFRLYKIPFIKRFMTDKVRAFVPIIDSSIGRIPY